MRARCVVVTVTVAAFAVASCSGSPPAEERVTPTPEASTPATATPNVAIGAKLKVAGTNANYHGTRDVAGERKVSIEIEDNYFSPTVIKGKPGQRILVSLENEAQSPHTFTIAGRYIDLEMQPGKLSEVRVTLPKSGNLSFYCRYQKKNGMAGGFNVTGPVAAPGPTSTPDR